MISLQIVPVAKPRMTQRDKWQQRPCVMRYRSFCDELRLLIGADYLVPEVLSIDFYLPIPSSWSKRRRLAMEGKPHQSKPDIDNLVKSFLDALCSDDAYVYSIQASKYYSEIPRIVLPGSGPIPD